MGDGHTAVMPQTENLALAYYYYYYALSNFFCRISESKSLLLLLIVHFQSKITSTLNTFGVLQV